MNNKLLFGVLCLAAGLSAPTQAQQTQLILPQNADDLRTLTQPASNAPCQQCGILVNVRHEQRARPASRNAPPPGSGLQPTPILSSGSAAKDARLAAQPITFYKLTVRLDDGTFAFYEQDDAPNIQKGDRVEIFEGRVRLRTP